MWVDANLPHCESWPNKRLAQTDALLPNDAEIVTAIAAQTYCTGMTTSRIARWSQHKRV
jgi:hypothetical protein